MIILLNLITWNEDLTLNEYQLLIQGGALRSEHWRSKVDLLLITVATNACKSGWLNDERAISIPSEATSTQASFQLAALRALLASLLSQAHIRPPYLAQGLELFRRGKPHFIIRIAMMIIMVIFILVTPLSSIEKFSRKQPKSH